MTMNRLKWRKVLGITVLLFVLLFSFYYWYTSVYLIQETPIPSKVREKILNLQEVDFAKLIDGEWDHLIVLSPYCDLKGDAKTYRFNFRRLANKSIEYREGQTLFIFCKKDRIESYFYLQGSLAYIDHEILPYSFRIPKADATFLPVKEGKGQKINLKNK